MASFHPALPAQEGSDLFRCAVRGQNDEDERLLRRRQRFPAQHGDSVDVIADFARIDVDEGPHPDAQIEKRLRTATAAAARAPEPDFGMMLFNGSCSSGGGSKRTDSRQIGLRPVCGS